MGALPTELHYALAFGLPFLLVATTTPLVGRLAVRLGAISLPRADRWHRAPTPLLGGLAIYGAVVVSLVLLGTHDGRLAGLVVGATLVCLLGLVDDLRSLPPHVKLLGQIAAACLFLIAGVRTEVGAAPVLVAVELAITIVWVVGITNAFNLLDNMDGLSAGIAAIAGGLLALHNLAQGNTALAAIGFVVAGAAAGFLVHNSHPASIFMGDCGSLTLGLLLAGLALLTARGGAPDLFLSFLVPVAILALPIFDTGLVALLRRYHGRPITRGGRDHLSHRLVALGLSERGAVLVLYALSAACGALGLFAIHLGFWPALALGSLGAVGIVLFGAFVAQVRVYAEPAAPVRPPPWVQPAMAAVALDAVLIAVAYLLAYLLKYEGNLSGAFLRQFADSLPYLLAIKLIALLAGGAYRPLWRYFSISDAFGLAVASAAGSVAVAAVVAITTGFAAYSRSVFVIDWLLCTTLLVAARVSFTLLADWFARLPRTESTRVLILGADDQGDLVLRALLRSPTYHVVGFLDPDPAKRQRRLHGVPILGTPRELLTVLGTTPVHEVIIATPLPPGPEHERFARLCEELGVPTRAAATLMPEALPAGRRRSEHHV
jgi:UDP-GlcNAc:undecaprenyl-phosphate GlcNAc-1-phosphate transferase